MMNGETWQALESSLRSVERLLRSAAREPTRQATLYALAEAQRELLIAQANVVRAEREQASVEDMVETLRRQIHELTAAPPLTVGSAVRERGFSPGSSG